MVQKARLNLKVSGFHEMKEKIESLNRAAKEVAAIIDDLNAMEVAIAYDGLEIEAQCDDSSKRDNECKCGGGCECEHVTEAEPEALETATASLRALTGIDSISMQLILEAFKETTDRLNIDSNQIMEINEKIKLIERKVSGIEAESAARGAK